MTARLAFSPQEPGGGTACAGAEGLPAGDKGRARASEEQRARADPVATWGGRRLLGFPQCFGAKLSVHPITPLHPINPLDLSPCELYSRPGGAPSGVRGPRLAAPLPACLPACARGDSEVGTGGPSAAKF